MPLSIRLKDEPTVSPHLRETSLPTAGGILSCLTLVTKLSPGVGASRLVRGIDLLVM